MLRKTTSKIRSFSSILLTTLRKRTNTSDYKRWSNEKNLFLDWDSRTEQISKLIDDDTSVIEFGAGRLILKSYLPEGCIYTPSDLVDRGQNTVICDLNNDLPQIQRYDFAVFSGVLEYIHNVPRLISYLSNYVDAIIASYAILESNKSSRRSEGWVNDYSSSELIKVFESAGYRCYHIEGWRTQLIYKFSRDPGTQISSHP